MYREYYTCCRERDDRKNRNKGDEKKSNQKKSYQTRDIFSPVI
jgi:hypothetical protein